VNSPKKMNEQQLEKVTIVNIVSKDDLPLGIVSGEGLQNLLTQLLKNIIFKLEYCEIKN
jgi:hypothetical protein